MNFFNKIFLKNFFNLSINQITNILVALIVTPFLFQKLGANQYGYIRLALAVTSLFGIFVSYGYHLNGPKRIALFNNSNKFKLQVFLNEILTLRIFLAIVSSIFICFLIHLHVFESYSIILLFSLTVIMSDASYPMFYFQGKDKLSLLAYSNFFVKVIYVILIFFLIENPSDSKYVNFSFGLSTVFIYILFWIRIYKKENINFILVSFKKLYFRLKENFEFFLSSIAGHVSTHGGLIILVNFVESKELGMYALAQKIGFLLRMIPVFFIQSLLQVFSKKNDKNKTSLKKDIKLFFYLGLFTTFLVAVIITFFSKWIIYFLAGKYIIYSQNILIILSFIPFFSMLNFKNMIEILINEKKDILNISTWMSSVFMVITVTYFCYYYGGYGLAIALILTEIASFLIHYYYLNKSISE